MSAVDDARATRARITERLAGSRLGKSLAREIDRDMLALKEAGAVIDALIAEGAAGDEHHSMDELYEYRMLYNAHAARGWLAAGVPVVKSWHHSDSELCFGGGWFIVVATLPTGQVSNHYAAQYWDLFDVPEVVRPPAYDGHDPRTAADRLAAALLASGSEGVAP